MSWGCHERDSHQSLRRQKRPPHRAWEGKREDHQNPGNSNTDWARGTRGGREEAAMDRRKEGVFLTFKKDEWTTVQKASVRSSKTRALGLAIKRQLVARIRVISVKW